MHKTFYISFFSIVFFLLIIACRNPNDFVEYRPHYRTDNHERYYGEAELDSTQYTNFIYVLDHFNETYKVKENNIILIERRLDDNWELLWNYTSKSQNKQWLLSH